MMGGFIGIGREDGSGGPVRAEAFVPTTPQPEAMLAEVLTPPLFRRWLLTHGRAHAWSVPGETAVPRDGTSAYLRHVLGSGWFSGWVYLYPPNGGNAILLPDWLYLWQALAWDHGLRTTEEWIDLLDEIVPQRALTVGEVTNHDRDDHHHGG